MVFGFYLNQKGCFTFELAWFQATVIAIWSKGKSKGIKGNHQSKSLQNPSESIKIQDIAIIIKNHRVLDLACKRSGRLLSDSVHIPRPTGAFFDPKRQYSILSFTIPWIGAFIFKEIASNPSKSKISRSSSKIIKGGFDKIMSTIGLLSSTRMGTVEVGFGGVEKRAWGFRNVHRVAQKHPWTFSNQL